MLKGWLLVYVVDAQRALELLQQYRAKLHHRHQNQSGVREGLGEEDHQLNQSLDRVIDVFQSQLFSALLGEDICFHFPTHSHYPSELQRWGALSQETLTVYEWMKAFKAWVGCFWGLQLCLQKHAAFGKEGTTVTCLRLCMAINWFPGLAASAPHPHLQLYSNALCVNTHVRVHCTQGWVPVYECDL